ncbi:MAG: hypothetical protein JWM36_4408 [Hyphomicrobiales bacterium]|nr:hypothetical protein [Hyphomicrobiales bacterium]
MKLVAAAAGAAVLLASLTCAQAQTETRVTVRESHPRVVKKVIVHHDRGLHRGWSHSRHRGRVVKKTIIER